MKAKVDAMHGFRSMRNAKSGGFPPQPPRPAAYPTAPRPNPNSSTERPKSQSSWEQFSNSIPTPGFPGMSRTASIRKGFAPSTPGAGHDEPPAVRTSAYASYTAGQRPPSSNPQSYFSPPNDPPSPTSARRENATSPLRHTQSSGDFAESVSRPHRPHLERMSTQYAHHGGETTFVNSGLGRSASVRNSPVDKTWQDEDNDLNRPHTHHGPSTNRHHSASPKLRPAAPHVDNYSSDDDSSEGEHYGARPKAQPRPRRQRAGIGGMPFGYRHVEPAVTGQVPNNNYKKVVSPQDEHTNHYEYPPPPPRGENMAQRIFSGAQHVQPNGKPHMNGHGRRSSSDADSGAPKAQPNMYGPFSSPSKTWSEEWFSPSNPRKADPSLRGLPSWAVPSSLLPRQSASVRKSRLGTIQEDNRKMHDWSSHADPHYNPELFKNADHVSTSSFTGGPGATSQPYAQPGYQSVSHSNINTRFSAADWDGKFSSGDEFFRPTAGRERTSPSRSSRPRAKSVSKVRTPAVSNESVPEVPKNSTVNGAYDEVPSTIQVDSDGIPHRSSETAFQPGKFSAEEWAAKLKDQTWAIPTTELNAKLKTPKRQSKSNPTKRSSNAPIIDLEADEGAPKRQEMESGQEFQSTEPKPASGQSNSRRASGAGVDPMDIDDSFSDTVISPPASLTPAERANYDRRNEAAKQTPVEVKLDDFVNVAPFAPSSTGLKDLDDLATTLPFESRAASGVGRKESISASSRRLNLPKPPKAIAPPARNRLNETTWKTYVADMNAYFYDWNVFNKKMIKHFESRQEQVDMSMANRWIEMQGDGNSGKQAGYATFMQWLEEDAQCREWWNVANEKNRECFEDLGKVRAQMKVLAGMVPA